MYGLLRKAFGPQSTSVTPLKSKDGTNLLRYSKNILQHWTEHFSDLFDNPSVVDLNIINNLPQFDVVFEIAIPLAYEETRKTIQEVNTGKAAGLDGIPVEVLLHGGTKMARRTHHLISDV